MPCLQQNVTIKTKTDNQGGQNTLRFLILETSVIKGLYVHGVQWVALTGLSSHVQLHYHV